MSYIIRFVAQSLLGPITFILHPFQQTQPLPPTTPAAMKNILILGGGYAGVSTAHRILKHTGKATPCKVTLVCPNTHMYWNMAAPRALIPGQLDDAETFRPIAEGFEHYPAGTFELVLGTAQDIDVEAKTVGIASQGRMVVGYDFLIIATGSHTEGDAPFKGLGSTEKTKEALHECQARIEKAKTIVVAGSGATGVEACGELAFEYGEEKDIILLASGDTILHESPSSVVKTATQTLQNLKAEIRTSTRVVSSTILPNNQTELLLSNGNKLIADLYLHAFGLIPNSSFIPQKFLNGNGFVVVDDYFAVKGAKDVYAIGDVCDVEPSQFIYADRQSTFLAKHFNAILSNKPTRPYKLFFMRVIGVSTGRAQATGHWGKVRMPGWVAFMIRKNLFLQTFEPIITGKLGDSPF